MNIFPTYFYLFHSQRGAYGLWGGAAVLRDSSRPRNKSEISFEYRYFDNNGNILFIDQLPIFKAYFPLISTYFIVKEARMGCGEVLRCSGIALDREISRK